MVNAGINNKTGINTFEAMAQLGLTRQTYGRLSARERNDVNGVMACLTDLWEQGIQMVRVLSPEEKVGDSLTLSSRKTGDELQILEKGKKTNFVTSLRQHYENTLTGARIFMKKIDNKTLVSKTDNETSREVFEISSLAKHFDTQA